MKKLLTKNNILIAISILIIIIGIIVVVVTGFKEGTEFGEITRIEAYIENGYNKNEIEQIAKETFSHRFIAQDVDNFNQIISIQIDEYTEEELNNFKTKLSEKYGVEAEELELSEMKVPSIKLFDIFKKYIWPIAIATVLILVYIGIRNMKQEPIKRVISALCAIVLTQGVYYSILAIARLPINNLTLAIGLTIYVLTAILQGKTK